MMCCYYPTTTIAIDDDVDFLNILTQHLGLTNCKSFYSPLQSFQHLSSHNAFERIQSRIISRASSSDNYATPEDHAIHFNIRNLHEEIYNQKRFQDISVLIVDYYMTEMNGIEFCEKLINHPSKKILLTGGLDKEKIAIEAFNKGIIHRFINKSDANFPTKLKQAVTVLQEAYFRDLSSTLFPYSLTMPLNIYQYPSYINFIRNIQNQVEGIEHYMLDAIGSTLILDSEGKPVWFVIKHESDLYNYEDLAIKQDAPKDFIQKIAERTVIPFFFSEEDYQYPVNQWKDFLYPCQPLPGMNDYYYAICHSSKNHVDKNKIISYSTYQQSLKTS